MDTAPSFIAPHSPAQALVIFAIALVALLAFVGLAIDTGALYVTYGQLKRAVDSSAVSAANDFKRGASLTRMTQDAQETLALHNVPLDELDLHVYICDADGDGVRDTSLATTVPMFYARCPDTSAPANQAARKLVWVDATQRAPLYFLQLVGARSISLHTDAIAEAAPVDVVIVMDTSESMGFQTTSPSPYVVNDYNPDSPSAPVGCNPIPSGTSAGTCHPLLEAKTAAKALIDTLYGGYDRVALVTFDQLGYVHPIPNLANTMNVSLTDNLAAAKIAVDAIKLHDDAPFNKVWLDWETHSGSYNPVDLEDRDGDGNDLDSVGYTCPTDPLDVKIKGRWLTVANGGPNLNGWGGAPCDIGTIHDSINWNATGSYTALDVTTSDAWLAANDPDGSGPLTVKISPLSTCSGCGLRVANEVFSQSGRPGAVWVLIFLSDGATNLSDRPGSFSSTYDTVFDHYPNGFCTGGLNSYNWIHGCMPAAAAVRHCIDTTAATCPPGSSWDGTIPSQNYNVRDYAYDKVDDLGLTKSTNLQEPGGSDVAIYSIGLGSYVTLGEPLLRYMAAVGDDGDRSTDPCSGITALTSCGQYYYAPSGSSLQRIFEDIATRIYTRITN